MYLNPKGMRNDRRQSDTVHTHIMKEMIISGPVGAASTSATPEKGTDKEVEPHMRAFVDEHQEAFKEFCCEFFPALLNHARTAQTMGKKGIGVRMNDNEGNVIFDCHITDDAFESLCDCREEGAEVAAGLAIVAFFASFSH